MAIDFQSGALVLSRATNPPVTTYPCTLSAWMCLPSGKSGSPYFGIALTDGTGTPALFGIKIADDTAGGWVGYAQAQVSGGSPNSLATSTGVTGAAANVWVHVCGVFTSATSRAVFVNGGNKGTDTTSLSVTGLSTTILGGFYPTIGDSAAYISDVAVWNLALTDAEVAALGRGMSPLFVRPSGLISYWPLETVASAGLNRVKASTDRTLSASTGSAAQSPIGGPPGGERYYSRPVGWRGNFTYVPGLQLAPGTNAFWKAGSDAATTNATAYTNEINKLIAVSLIQAIPGAALVASTFATASPAIGVATLVQTQALAAPPTLAVASPAVGAAALAQGHALAASPLAAGAPVLGAPAMGVQVALVASGLTVSSPAIAAPAVSQSNLLTAASLTVGAPAIGTTALAQAHALAAPALAVASPVSGAAALAQTHVMTAAGLAVTSPQLGAGAFQQNYHLLAVGMAVSAPAVGPSIITHQTHVLTAAALAVSTPVLGPGALKQKQVIVATGMVAGSPVISVPVVSAGRAFVAVSMTVSQPVISTAIFKQVHALAALRFTVSAPTVGASKAVIKAPPLFAANLTVGSPQIAPVRPALGFMSVLAAPNFTVGKIEFSYPDAEAIGPPEVFFPVRYKRWSNDPNAEFYDDDHSQFNGYVKQAIFTHMNDAIEMWMSSGTLAGRTDRERGPVQDIIVSKPLWLADKKLGIDWSAVEQLRIDVNALTTAVTANTAQIAANVAAINANTAQVAINTAAVATNSALLASLRTDFEKLLRQTKTFIPRDVTVSSPVLGTPQAAIKLSAATNAVVGSPVLGTPVLVRIP